MNLRLLITSTLAAHGIVATGCAKTWVSGNCESEPFDTAMAYTQSDMESVLERSIEPGETLDEDDCLSMCEWSNYYDAIDTLDSCTLEWSDGTQTADTGSEPSAILTCSGSATPICMGRRPLGHTQPRQRGATPLAQTLAEAAHLEAASVIAFARLARDLVRLGAPAGLVARARAAAQDEVRHARSLGHLARQHGAQPAPVTVRAQRRDLRSTDRASRAA